MNTQFSVGESIRRRAGPSPRTCLSRRVPAALPAGVQLLPLLPNLLGAAPGPEARPPHPREAQHHPTETVQNQVRISCF